MHTRFDFLAALTGVYACVVDGEGKLGEKTADITLEHGECSAQLYEE